jgi:hypothetical protein
MTVKLVPPKLTAVEALQMYRDGMTLAEIGAEFGVTRQRVHQILSKTRQRGWGQAAKLRATRALGRADIAESKDVRCREWYGCSFKEYSRVTGFSEVYGAHIARDKQAGVLLHAYWMQKINARARGIRWKLTLPVYSNVVGPHLGSDWPTGVSLERKKKTRSYSKDNIRIVKRSPK